MSAHRNITNKEAVAEIGRLHAEEGAAMNREAEIITTMNELFDAFGDPLPAPQESTTK